MLFRSLIQYPGLKAGAYTIPSSVTTIWSNAFYKCNGLTSVIIPSNVVTIWSLAFSGCTNLTNVNLPSNLTTIGYGAFQDCSNLLSAYFTGNKPSTISGDLFYNTHNGFIVFYFNGKTGFTSPTWVPNSSQGYSYTAVNIGTPTTLTLWLLSNGFKHTENLLGDPNSDGVSLLTAYALNLDPNQNLSGKMPVPAIAGNALAIPFYAGSEAITYSVETSTDLQNWTTIGVTLSAPNSNQYRTASVALDGPRRFLRLVFTK